MLRKFLLLAFSEINCVHAAVDARGKGSLRIGCDIHRQHAGGQFDFLYGLHREFRLLLLGRFLLILVHAAPPFRRTSRMGAALFSTRWNVGRFAASFTSYSA